MSNSEFRPKKICNMILKKYKLRIKTKYDNALKFFKDVS